MGKMTFDLKVESFMVSCAYDIHRGGEKIGNFVSMTFRPTSPLTTDEALIAEVEASEMVTRAAIMNGVTRNAFSVELAQDMIKDSSERHNMMAESIRVKAKIMSQDARWTLHQILEQDGINVSGDEGSFTALDGSAVLGLRELMSMDLVTVGQPDPATGIRRIKTKSQL